MNERIEELAGQAKFMAEETINRQISYNAELQAFAEKFAELIVGECLVMADEFELDVNRSGHVDRMKNHFGVED